jgi:tetratricopeptide (TPR) repeat protein
LNSNRHKEILTPALVFLGAFFLNALLFLELKNSPLFFEPEMDMLWHWQWANEIASGNLRGESAPFFRAPLYPYFLAVLVLLSGKNIIWVRLLQAFFGSLTGPLAYWLARRTGLGKGASIAVAAVTFSWPLVLFFDLEFLMPVLLLPLDLAGLVLLLGIDEKKKPAAAFWPGLVFSFSLITRPDIMMVWPAFLAWSFFKFRKFKPKYLVSLWLWFALGFFSLGSVVFARNLVVGKEPVFISTQGGVNFWIGNHPESDGHTAVAPGPLRGVGDYVDNVWLNSRAAAERDLGRRLKEGEISDYWFAKGLDFWKDDPASALGLLFKKVYYLVNGEEISSNLDYYYFRAESRIMKVLLWKKILKFPFGLLMPLALAGVFWARKKGPDFWLLVLFCACYGMGVALFFVNARFRAPLVPVLVVISALGLKQAWADGRAKSWKELVPGIVILLTFLFVSNSNFFDVTKYDRARNWVRAGTYYYEKRDFNQALRNYAQAIELNPDSTDAFVGAGNVALLKNKLPEALRFYQMAEEVEPMNGQVKFNLGLTYARLGDMGASERKFEEALQIFPDYAKAREELEWIRSHKAK